MLRVVVAPLVSSQEGCRSCHMYLSLLVVSTVIQKITDDTIINLNGRLLILTACLIFTDRHPNSSLKLPYISVDPLNKLAMPVLGLINRSHTANTRQPIATQDHQHSLFKAWSQVNR